MPVMELGDGNAISAEIRVVPQFVDEGKAVAFFLTCLGGPISDIAGFRPMPLMIAELGKIPLADLQARIAEAFAPKPEIV